jgi:hypothetical protein
VKGIVKLDYNDIDINFKIGHFQNLKTFRVLEISQVIKAQLPFTTVPQKLNQGGCWECAVFIPGWIFLLLFFPQKKVKRNNHIADCTQSHNHFSRCTLVGNLG